MTKFLTGAACGVVLIAGGVLISNSQDKPTGPAPEADGKAEVSDSHVYGAFFRQAAAISAKADEAQLEGVDSGKLRSHLANVARLSDYESTVLGSVVEEYVREIKKIEERTTKLVEAARAQYPGGRVPAGEVRAPEPPEFRELRLKRDQLHLKLRDDLRNALSPESFARFDTFVRRKIPNGRFFPIVTVN